MSDILIGAIGTPGVALGDLNTKKPLEQDVPISFSTEETKIPPETTEMAKEMAFDAANQVATYDALAEDPTNDRPPIRDGERPPEPPKDENGNPLPPPNWDTETMGEWDPSKMKAPPMGKDGKPPEPPKDENGNPLPPPDEVRASTGAEDIKTSVNVVAQETMEQVETKDIYAGMLPTGYTLQPRESDFEDQVPDGYTLPEGYSIPEGYVIKKDGE